MLSLGSNVKHTSPVFSPDSRKLAFLTAKNEGNYGVQQYITIVDLYTRQRQSLIKDWDFDPISIDWSSYFPNHIIMRAYYHAQSLISSLL